MYLMYLETILMTYVDLLRIVLFSIIILIYTGTTMGTVA